MRHIIRTIRFNVGHHLLTWGLAALPDGPVKEELYELFEAWTTKVYRTIAEHHNKSVKPD